ncbi:MAG: precorrin-6B methylase, partial [Agathobaculum sp.]|uniref:precorrin-6B methylase n=1 Tax=Agathobaculum sp. TaxID=2048138 RepID=UPI003D8F7382
MENQMFTNDRILAWLQYFAYNAGVDLEKVKMLDITRKNKNLIPTVESNRTVLVFTDAGNPDIFYKMWDVGLGECDVWYNEGSDPIGPIKHDKLKNMIDRGINASAGMLIVNPNARTTYKIGMDNSSFSRGSIHYVGSEIRAVILNKLHIDQQDTVCIISGESIAVEAALIASEGTVIAVEYSRHDRATMDSNIQRFGLNNVSIIDHVDDDTMAGLPVPSLAFLVASASMEQEIACLLRVNPHMEFVVYTLDFGVVSKLPQLFEKFGIGDM